MAAVHALADELGADEVQLSVWAFNEGAVAFFAEHGFAPAFHRMVRRR